MHQATVMYDKNKAQYLFQTYLVTFVESGSDRKSKQELNRCMFASDSTGINGFRLEEEICVYFYDRLFGCRTVEFKRRP